MNANFPFCAKAPWNRTEQKDLREAMASGIQTNPLKRRALFFLQGPVFFFLYKNAQILPIRVILIWSHRQNLNKFIQPAPLKVIISVLFIALSWYQSSTNNSVLSLNDLVCWLLQNWEWDASEGFQEEREGLIYVPTRVLTPWFLLFLICGAGIKPWGSHMQDLNTTPELKCPASPFPPLKMFPLH